MRFFGFLIFLFGAAMALAFYHGDELGLSQYAGMGENQLLAVYFGILVAACGLMMVLGGGRAPRAPGAPPPMQRRGRR